MKLTIIVLTAASSLLGACDVPPAERAAYSQAGSEPASSQPTKGQGSTSAESMRKADPLSPEQRETAVDDGTTNRADPARSPGAERKAPPSAPPAPPKPKPGEVILPAPEQAPAEVDPPHRYPGDEVPG